ncbi:hypothetical protein PIB30_050889 [Stylosanthes scabra]|uniref:Uncharacterized protein n=1 Tax=Stylosanthes scabra TaxID=79078 RepID=A0ABU6WG50_9FABA|nr:hypothetical protein [Stylosanthes scabra]
MGKQSVLVVLVSKCPARLGSPPSRLRNVSHGFDWVFGPKTVSTCFNSNPTRLQAVDALSTEAPTCRGRMFPFQWADPDSEPFAGEVAKMEKVELLKLIAQAADSGFNGAVVFGLVRWLLGFIVWLQGLVPCSASLSSYLFWINNNNNESKITTIRK